MILIKGFLRSKSTKTYIFIFTILLVAVSIIYSFSKYYASITTTVYQENSYFLVVGEKDLTNLFRTNNNIINVEQVILLEPENIVLENSIYDGNKFVDPKSNYIVVVSDKNKKNKLDANQIIIDIPKFIFDNTIGLVNLKNKNISLIDNNEKFDIVSIRESNFNRMIISENTFKKMLADNNYYAYIFLINNYDEKDNVIEYLEKQNNIEVNFIEFYNSSSQLDTIESLKAVIHVLTFTCNTILIFFSILFLIITHNIIQEELDKMRTEQLLGYNKIQIKRFLIMKIISINFIIFLIYIVTYFSVNCIMKYVLKINNYIFDFYAIYAILLLFVISILSCTLHKIKGINL